MKDRLTQQRVLVSSSHHLQPARALVPAQPAPAGTLDRGRLGVHLGLERLEGAKVLFNLLDESGRGVGLARGRVGRGEVAPEEGVVPVD